MNKEKKNQFAFGMDEIILILFIEMLCGFIVGWNTRALFDKRKKNKKQ